MGSKGLNIFIGEGCGRAGPGDVAGLTRRARLKKTLARGGDRIVADRGDADAEIPECVLPVGGKRLHVCDLSKTELEAALLSSLRKPTDGIIARWINRPLSLAVTRLLMNTGVRPNHVSTVTLILGVLAGFLAADGSYLSGVLGALSLQIQSVLDGVDGELSRLRFESSKLGQWLDTISDDLAEFSFLAGLTFATQVPWLKTYGLCGLAAYAAAKAVLYYLLATVFESGNLQDFKWEMGKPKSWTSKLELLSKHDFLCLLFFGLALAGCLDFALFLMASGAFVVAAKLAQQLLSKRPGRSPLTEGPA